MKSYLFANFNGKQMCYKAWKTLTHFSERIHWLIWLHIEAVGNYQPNFKSTELVLTGYDST